MEAVNSLPRVYLWRRLHSLAGLWFVLFLFEHLLVNSQASIWLGGQGNSLVRLVEGLHDLPYLHAIEFFLLGVPIGIHVIWGIQYLFSAKFNSFPTDGRNPSLTEYGRNHAYTWQRITSWILLFLLVFHLVKFRIIEYPQSFELNGKEKYLVYVHSDQSLIELKTRFPLQFYDDDSVQNESWLQNVPLKPLKKGTLLVVSDSFGAATLLTVRDTFKNPYYVALYTIFVLAACFHAFNGFWTFLITWGIVLKMAAQRRMLKVAWGLMALVSFFGLAAIWGSYLNI